MHIICCLKITKKSYYSGKPFLIRIVLTCNKISTLYLVHLFFLFFLTITLNKEKFFMLILPMFPNMIPFSVEATLTLALILQKSCGAMVIGVGFSTSFKSPKIIHTSLI